MAVDPTLLMTLEAFGFRIKTYIDGFKAQPGNLCCGRPEWERRRKRDAKGIPASRWPPRRA
jgi:LDH2 family malate/lactate/ureidoglycolate dehydrogenase